jgi:hypothetical protein
MSTALFNHPHAVPTTTGGLVFTNNKGQVIFANQAFLDLMQIERRQTLMGKPLHTVLGVEARDTQQLVHEHKGASKSVVLSLRDRRGTMKSLEMESIPTYDSSDRFLGINIIVKPLDEPSPAQARIPAYPAPTPEQLERFAASKTLDEKTIMRERGAYLRDFFTAQIDELQIFIARVAGLRVREAMEMVFNEASQKHLWPIAMVDGNVYIDPVAEEPAVYRLLLGELSNYAASVIGWHAVATAMRQVECQFSTEILNLATETGLRSIYLQR